MFFLISLIFSFSAFSLLYFMIKAGFLISLAAFFILLISVNIVLTKIKNKNTMEIKMADPQSPMTIRKTIFEGRKKVSRIRSAANVIRKPEAREKILQICSLADQIFKNFEKDPADMKAGKKFLNYYLDATVNIVEKYKELSRQNLTSKDSTDALNKSDEVLETIREAFEKQLGKLLDNDIMDLDTEISLLEQTFKMENLGK